MQKKRKYESQLQEILSFFTVFIIMVEGEKGPSFNSPQKKTSRPCADVLPTKKK